MEERLYPIVVAEGDSDPRFTFGFVLEVAMAFERYGYPKLADSEFVELRQMLFRFLYGDWPEVEGRGR